MAKARKTPKATLRLFTRAANRFNPNAPQGYVAVDVSHAPIRETREQAYQDYLDVYYQEN